MYWLGCSTITSGNCPSRTTPPMKVMVVMGCCLSCLLVAMFCQASPQHMTTNCTFYCGEYSSELLLNRPVRINLRRSITVTPITHLSVFSNVCEATYEATLSKRVSLKAHNRPKFNIAKVFSSFPPSPNPEHACYHGD